MTKDEDRVSLIKSWQERLSEIKDVDILLENILNAACEILNADAGSIYDLNEEDQSLTIKHSKNITFEKKLQPGEKMPYTAFTFSTKNTMAGYCALTKKVINIPDCYNIGEYLDEEKKEKTPFTFNPSSDEKTGYHTTSMLICPLLTTNGKIHGVLQIINAKDENNNIIPFDKNAEIYILSFTKTLSQIYDYAFVTKQLIERLCKAASYRDPLETGKHVDRVSTFSVELYDRYAFIKNIPEAERLKYRDNLKLAAKCHDVGKLAVPDEVLKKNGPLTDEERNIMKTHSIVGAQIFSPAESEMDKMALDICLHHHDRWDGSPKGYPGKYDDVNSYEAGTPFDEKKFIPLSGTNIPLCARIVAIADVYDALRHKRCYKDSWPSEKTFDLLNEERGHQFDPELIDCMLQIRDRIEAINDSLS